MLLVFLCTIAVHLVHGGPPFCNTGQWGANSFFLTTQGSHGSCIFMRPNTPPTKLAQASGLTTCRATSSIPTYLQSSALVYEPNTVAEENTVKTALLGDKPYLVGLTLNITALQSSLCYSASRCFAALETVCGTASCGRNATNFTATAVTACPVAADPLSRNYSWVPTGDLTGSWCSVENPNCCGTSPTTVTAACQCANDTSIMLRERTLTTLSDVNYASSLATFWPAMTAPMCARVRYKSGDVPKSRWDLVACATVDAEGVLCEMPAPGFFDVFVDHPRIGEGMQNTTTKFTFEYNKRLDPSTGIISVLFPPQLIPQPHSKVTVEAGATSGPLLVLSVTPETGGRTNVTLQRNSSVADASWRIVFSFSINGVSVICAKPKPVVGSFLFEARNVSGGPVESTFTHTQANLEIGSIVWGGRTISDSSQGNANGSGIFVVKESNSPFYLFQEFYLSPSPTQDVTFPIFTNARNVGSYLDAGNGKNTVKIYNFVRRDFNVLGKITDFLSMTMSSSDPRYDYQGVTLPLACSFYYVNQDMDVADVNYYSPPGTKVSGFTIAENSGSPVYYAVRLTAMPLGATVVSFENDYSSFFTIMPDNVTIAPASWNNDVTFTFTSYQNNITTEPTSMPLKLRVTSALDTAFTFNRTVLVTWQNDDRIPKITNINPTTSSTEGTTTMEASINDYQQGPLAGRKIFLTRGGNTTECPNYREESGTVKCTYPPGTGDTISIKFCVYVDGPTAPLCSVESWDYDYAKPTVESINPTQILGAGTDWITITGQNFGGPEAPAGTISVVFAAGPAIGTASALSSCTLSITAPPSHSRIVCLSPPGSGSGIIVQVRVNGRFSSEFASTNPPNTILYRSPNIYSIDPKNGPTVGGNVVTIEGVNFGLPTSSQFVSFFYGSVSRACTTPVWISDGKIRCNAPAGSGEGITLTVKVADQTSSMSGAMYSYNPPAVSGIFPLTPSPFTPGYISISGLNFGVWPGEVAAAGSSVRVDTKACLQTKWTSDTLILCDVPQGVGSGRQIVVSVTNRVSAPFLFNYAPPVVTLVNPATVSARGNEVITLFGKNFASQAIILGKNQMFFRSLDTGQTMTQFCDDNFSQDVTMVCPTPDFSRYLPDTRRIAAHARVGTQIGTGFDITTLIRWTNLAPREDVGRPGKFITITGFGFVKNHNYSCSFNFDQVALGANYSFIETSPVTPSNITTPSSLICPLPQWPFASAKTTVSIKDLSAYSAFGVAYVAESGSTNMFTFLPGWDSLQPTEMIAGVPAPLTIVGGGFSALNEYVCKFQIGLNVIPSTNSSVVSFDKLLCWVPPTTLGLGGKIASITVVIKPSESVINFLDNDVAKRMLSLTHGPPISLRPPTIVSTTSFSITISWQLPNREEANGSPVTSHRLYLNDLVIFSGVPPPTLTFTTSNLFPQRSYEVSVGYVNALGPGLPGPSAVATTQRSPPILYSISPSSGFQVGGVNVTIVGDQFGLNRSEITFVRIDGKDCPIFFWSNSSLGCTTPATTVASSVAVLVSSVIGVSASVSETGPAVPRPNNALSFEYLPSPVVTAVAPPSVPITGRIAVKVYGNFLGQNKTDVASISLAGIPCLSITYISRTDVVCLAAEAPAKTLGTVTVTTHLGGSNQVSVPFLYSTPELVSISPAKVEQAGGQKVTIVGRNMGINFKDIISVSIGGFLADLTSMTWSRRPDGLNEIIFASPEIRFLGVTDVRVNTTSGGPSPSVPPLLVTIFAENYSELPPLTTAVSPAFSAFSGGVLVSIYGEGFGYGLSDLEDVTLVGASCRSSAEWISDSLITCKTPASFSENSVGVVTVKTTSRGPGRGAAVFAFRAETPIIDNFRPSSSGALGFTVVTLRGKNFGTRPRTISITINAVPCVESLWKSDGEVECKVPPLETILAADVSKTVATESGLTFRVEVGGLVSLGKSGFVYGQECDPPCGWNGKCQALTGLCQCDQFYFGPPACASFLVETQTASVARAYESPSSNFFFGGGADNVITIRLYEAPSSAVVFTVSVPTNGDVVLSKVGSSGEGKTEIDITFTPSDFSVPQTVMVEGKPDLLREGDEAFDVAVRFKSGGDSKFKGVPEVILPFLVTDTVPEIMGAEPILSRPSGTSLTIWGKNLDPVANFVVGGVPVPVESIKAILVSRNGTFYELDLGYANLTEIAPFPVRYNATADFSAASSARSQRFSSRFSSQQASTTNTTTAVPNATSGPTVGTANATSAGNSTGASAPTTSGGNSTSTTSNSTSPSSSDPVSSNTTAAAPPPAKITVLVNPVQVKTGRFPGLPDPFDGFVAEYRLVTPPSIVGYQTITVVHGDRQNASLANALFYTEDCIEKGYYGRGSECIPCPEGAICPGGDRLIPKEGYWSPSENAGFVYPCIPPEACKGGVNSECAKEYRGEYCKQCAYGYYRDPSNICEICPKKVIIGLYLLISLALWFSLAAAGWFLTDSENVSRCAFFVLSLQTFGAVGAMLGPNAPSRARRLFEFFILFSGDYSFLKPECLRKGTEKSVASDFFVQVTYSCLIGAVLVIGVPVIKFLSKVCDRKKGAELLDRKNEFYASRKTRMITVWFSVVYYPLTKAALTTFACIPLKGTDEKLSLAKRKYVLVADPTVTCFKGSHRMLFVVGLMVFFVITIGWPVHMLRLIRRTKEWLFLDMDFSEAYGFMYQGYKPKWYLWYGMDAFVLFIMACADALITDPFTNVVLLVGTYVTYMFIALLLRPFRSRLEGAINTSVNLITIMALFYNYITSQKSTGKLAEHIDKMTQAIIISVLLTMFVLIMMLVYYLVLKWKHKSSIHGEDYFISKAIDDSFKMSKVIGDYYLDAVKDNEALEEISDDGKRPELGEDEEVLDTLVRNSSRRKSVVKKSREGRKKKVLREDFIDKAIGNLIKVRSLKGGSRNAAAGEHGGSSDDDGDDDERKPLESRGSAMGSNPASSTSAPMVAMGAPSVQALASGKPAFSADDFLIKAQRKAKMNRYGTAVLDGSSDDDDGFYRPDEAETADSQGEGTSLIPSTAAAVKKLIKASNEDGEDEEGFGVFFDEPSKVEFLLNSINTMASNMVVKSHKDYAFTLLRYRINVADPDSVVPERINEINRTLVMRRVQVALLNLAALAPEHVVCLKHYDPAWSNNQVKRAACTFRYIFPWNQVSFNGGGPVGEMLDAIVLEVCEQVRVNAVKRLNNNEVCVISDLVVKVLDFPFKRIMIIHITC